MNVSDRAERGYIVHRWSTVALSAITLVVALLTLSPRIHSRVPAAPLEGRPQFGVCVASRGGTIDRYDAAHLRAGWYVNWSVRLDPPEPAGMEYAQMVRLHQVTTCWPERIRDRVACPYVQPYTYTLTNASYENPGQTISHDEITSIAQANPGSLWLIGNEMDRYDWGVRDPDNPGEYIIAPGGQDEMVPELYAQAYHELYNLIKGADASARLAIGGVIQPTPLRLAYLDQVVAAYQSEYGGMIPVDVWNMHNMILHERSCAVYPENCWGADVPPGVAGDEGMLYGIDDVDNISIFQQHIVAFRQWMEDKGERDKPLIISEYSVLFGEIYGFDYPRVRDYMLATFDYMTTETDPLLGYPGDGNRLVQRWAWYSLNDDGFGGYVSHHHLFDPDTKDITLLGVDYGAYPLAKGAYLPVVLSSMSNRDWMPARLPLSRDVPRADT